MYCCRLSSSLPVFGLLALAGIEGAAERVTLTESNCEEYAPRGKEVDCIYGDTVLRNDTIVLVIAQPIATRNANMTVKRVGGAIIDMTLVDTPNDQLSAYYPAGGLLDFEEAMPADPAVGSDLAATEVHFVVSSRARENQTQVDATYRLRDGEPYIWLETIWSNPHDLSVELTLPPMGCVPNAALNKASM